MTNKERQHTMGSGGTCICPKCNNTVPHQPGVQCQDSRCPDCGAKMLRVGSRHYELWQKKHSS